MTNAPNILADKEIKPAKKGEVAMGAAQAQENLTHLGESWHLNAQSTLLQANFKFQNFKKALLFVNELGAIADAAMHHPDIALGWGYVKLNIQTHSIGGLHEADFVLAAKANQLYENNFK